MKREEQDKLWAELSEENKTHYREQYSEQKTMSESGVPHLLEELFGSHNLQPSLTYEDVARELFGTGIDGKCQFATVPYMGMKWANKIQAMGRLLAVAKFLNKNEDGSDWVITIEDWDDIEDDFYTLGIDPADNEIHVVAVNKMRLATEIVYFRTKELAEQAVQILGEDVVRTALTTNY